MRQLRVNLTEIVKELFPNFASASIQPKKGTNGAPFLIDDGSKYWLKLVNSSQLEDILKDVERQALQEIKSPFIIELLDVKTKIVNGQRYDGLLFRYIDGEDLKSIFTKKKSSKQPFTENEIRKLLADIGKGIQAISSKGWVHQDIKQKNIRYDKQNDRFVILDFGLAYYSRNFQSPTGKHNKDYASPEQAYASVDKERVPLITFRSDIAQLGQLAYELLTLKNPFKDDGQSKLNLQRITKGEYQPLKELNSTVSDDLVKIIDTMLNRHPADRYRSPEDFLCALEGKQYVQQFKFEKGVYFQVWKGPHGYKKNIKQVSDEIQGVVVSASQMLSNDFIDEVKEKGVKLIFDPETYLLTEDIHSSWHGGLSQWDWYLPSLKPDYFKQKTRITTFISQVVQAQKDLDVDYIMPPYFNVANPDSEWRNLNGLFYHECLQYCRRISLDKPVICPISVSQAVIGVDRSRKDLVDFYSQLPDLTAFFLRINVKEHNTSIPVIQATTKLIEELERHYPVLLADAGTVVFGYFAKGLSACVTSLVDSKREHDLTAMQVNKKEGGSYKEKFFIPKIYQFVKVVGDLPALIGILGTDALCSCRVCKNAKADSSILKTENPNAFISRWDKTNRGNHFFSCISEWRTKMFTLAPDKRMEEYKNTINDALAIYSRFKTDLIFGQIIKREDCADWEAAFFSQ